MARQASTKIVRQLRSGQVTIPRDFRESLGIQPDDLLRVTLREGKLEIAPVEARERASGSPWLKELYDMFAPVREPAARLGGRETDKLIDRAVTETRRRRA